MYMIRILFLKHVFQAAKAPPPSKDGHGSSSTSKRYSTSALGSYVNGTSLLTPSSTSSISVTPVSSASSATIRKISLPPPPRDHDDGGLVNGSLKGVVNNSAVPGKPNSASATVKVSNGAVHELVVCEICDCYVKVGVVDES
jgi:hypothetical protein